MLAGKTVVLGITGGIAAYKAVEIASKLTQGGIKVEVIMTEAATHLVAPLTLSAVAHTRVAVDMFEWRYETSASHVAFATAADVVLIAPATANSIAKIANGIADNLLTNIILATRAPVVVAPAMHEAMYQNPATQENIAKLKERNFTIVEPGYGRLASGRRGIGRLADIDKIIGMVKQALGRQGDLAGKRIVVTAGGTQEPIDPVRCITNHSSGKMGYAIAEAARNRGALVTLISAPVALAAPAGIDFVPVQTALEMKEAVEKAVAQSDSLIMAAAVADYQPETVSEAKIKKDNASLVLKLKRTPDILGEIKGSFMKVGFAAESENLVTNAKQKLEKKNMDLIVANDITEAGCGFEVNTNKVTLIDKNSKIEELPLLAKREVADRILDRVAALI